MLPASFAPMILKLVMPKIMDNVMKVFKLDKVLEYVEKPNSADDKLIVHDRELKLLREMVIDLGKESHPPVIDLDEWEDVKDTIKKLKNKKVFKKLGK